MGKPLVCVATQLAESAHLFLEQRKSTGLFSSIPPTEPAFGIEGSFPSLLVTNFFPTKVLSPRLDPMISY